MSGEGSEVYFLFVEVNRDVVKGLDGVGMYECFSLVGCFSDLWDGLVSFGFVVDSYDGNNVKIVGVFVYFIWVDKFGMVYW